MTNCCSGYCLVVGDEIASLNIPICQNYFTFISAPAESMPDSHTRWIDANVSSPDLASSGDLHVSLQQHVCG